MKLPSPCLISSAALAALLTWLIAWHPLSWPGPAAPCRLEVIAASASATQMTVRLDEGHGFDDGRATDLIADLPPDSNPRTIVLALPPQRVRGLKLVFSSTPAIVISAARITFEGRTLTDLLPQLHAGASTLLDPGNAGLLFRSAPGRSSLATEWLPAHPMILPAGDEPWIAETMAYFAILTTLLTLLQAALARRGPSPAGNRLSALAASFVDAAQKRPVMSLAFVGLCASVVSCYPVVFGNKSFVSPTIYPYLLYGSRPTIPGALLEPAENVKGSDVAATMIYSIPNSAIEHDAIFRDHQWPLWNRYNSGGLPLLGQGQSMVGNPLHLLAILANGAAWAWDLKFLIAKALFSFGVGLCAWLLTRRLGVAGLVGASASWTGFFAYRMNHPAFFSFCFAPFVLLPWIGALSAPSKRAALAAFFGLILADGCELTSGTAKEACMILVFLNAAGFLIVVLSPVARAIRWRIALTLLAASLCFLLLSAPAWLPFLDALQQGVSCYDAPAAYQLYPGMLVAFFDDIFSQDFTLLEIHTHPSINFLALAGVLWLAVAPSGQTSRRPALALWSTAAVLAALVFGVVPPDWLKAAPLIGHIYHIFNTFGVPLILIALLLGALGLSQCLDAAASREWPATYRRMLIAGAGVLALYLGLIQVVPPAPLPAFSGNPPWHSRFFLGYALALLTATAVLPLALRWTQLGGGRRLAGGLTLGACLVALHFRHGMYVHTRFDDYVMTPRSAAELDAPSPALTAIDRHLAEPARTAGFDLTFSPGYNALMRLEGISNLDTFSNRYYLELIQAAHLPALGPSRIMLPPRNLGNLKPILDLLNLRYYLREPKPGLPPPQGLSPVGVADLEIFESREAWPRAFFTDCLLHYGSAADLVSIVEHGDGRPFAAIQGGSAAPDATSYATRAIVPASRYRLSSNVTELTVEAPGPGVIVLGENFEEGNFRVAMNGKAAPYCRVNHAFKGVKVDRAGPCQLRFEYWPRMLTLSLWLSAAGTLLALLSATWLARRPAHFFTPAE